MAFNLTMADWATVVKPETESGPEEQRQDIDQPAPQGSVARRLRGLNTQYIRQDRDRAQGFNHQTAWYPESPAQSLENLIQAVYAVAVGVDNPLEETVFFDTSAIRL
uniref:Transposase n=1 Tax=Steinernema glaseri TaxID=37863 RepID=A0A1I8AFM8_9BILA